MRVSLKQLDKTAYFEGTTESGHSFRLNSTLTSVEEKKAPSPMEALLIAAASCTSVDIVLILGKMKQEMEDFSVDIQGEREQIGDAKPFRKIHLIYNYKGNLDEKKVKRATKLSVEKYCSVLESLHPDCDVSWKVNIS